MPTVEGVSTAKKIGMPLRTAVPNPWTVARSHSEIAGRDTRSHHLLVMPCDASVTNAAMFRPQRLASLNRRSDMSVCAHKAVDIPCIEYRTSGH